MEFQQLVTCQQIKPWNVLRYFVTSHSCHKIIKWGASIYSMWCKMESHTSSESSVENHCCYWVFPKSRSWHTSHHKPWQQVYSCSSRLFLQILHVNLQTSVWTLSACVSCWASRKHEPAHIFELSTSMAKKSYTMLGCSSDALLPPQNCQPKPKPLPQLQPKPLIPIHPIYELWNWNYSPLWSSADDAV